MDFTGFLGGCCLVPSGSSFGGRPLRLGAGITGCPEVSVGVGSGSDGVVLLNEYADLSFSVSSAESAEESTYESSLSLESASLDRFLDFLGLLNFSNTDRSVSSSSIIVIVPVLETGWFASRAFVPSSGFETTTEELVEVGAIRLTEATNASIKDAVPLAMYVKLESDTVTLG
ncbi:hypothetical protein WICPIJ_007443 [Wickerhamomyces pijperi]|uniref:Uncharacterized protein n=1 Tax=Wickerhamomyces pijperi TaxID=599730 RepID=A0A9P8Q2H9_WICPI|nr:hypothetical protein WICPIJ_007443 [Wickerhamomyces pijperi]